MAMQLESVEFLKAWRGYTAGEVAGFKPYVANQLVERGLAKKNKSSNKRQNLKQDAVDDRKSKTIQDESVNK